MSNSVAYVVFAADQLEKGGIEPGPALKWAEEASRSEALERALEVVDLDGAYAFGMDIAQALGFGPEASPIVLGVLGIFVLMLVVGYLANPTNSIATKQEDTKTE